MKGPARLTRNLRDLGDTPNGRRLVARAGFVLSTAVTLTGIVYAAGITWAGATGNLSPRLFSPVAQTAVGLATLITAQLILALSVCLDRALPSDRRLFSQLGIVFAACFTVTVSINRFVQLAVVRPAQISGNTDQLGRFLPYEPDSAMFALEVLGWGIFLSLAALALAPAFRGSRLETGIRWSCIVYGILGLAGAAGYALRTRWFALGFVAWGLVLYVWTAFLMVWFWRLTRSRSL